MRPGGAERLVITVPGIVLVSPGEERFEWEDDEHSIFVFQRYISEQMAEWERQYPFGPDGSRPNKYVSDVITSCLWTWRDVTYDDGEEINYDQSLVHLINETTRKNLIDLFKISTPPGVKPFVSEIEYRRLPPHEEDRLISKHSEQGILDSRAMGAELLEYCITGWREVYDWGGQAVDFDPDRLRFLPQDSRNRMGKPVRASSGISAKHRTELLGNSEAGSNASTLTENSPAETVGVNA